MPADLQLLGNALAGRSPAGQDYRWADLLSALASVISTPLTPEAERVILEIIRFDSELRLDESSEMPHRLSPEDMLESLSIQGLGKWGRTAHLAEIERIESTARSPGLASVARAIAQRLRQLPGSNGAAPLSADLAHSPEPRGVRRGEGR